MASLIPALGACASRMTSGERRLAERLEQKLDDDYPFAGPQRATQNPALSAALGLNLLAGYLMNSGNRPEIMKKPHINQQLADIHLLAGYLMGLCGNRQKSGA